MHKPRTEVRGGRVSVGALEPRALVRDPSLMGKMLLTSWGIFQYVLTWPHTYLALCVPIAGLLGIYFYPVRRGMKILAKLGLGASQAQCRLHLSVEAALDGWLHEVAGLI